VPCAGRSDYDIRQSWRQSLWDERGGRSPVVLPPAPITFSTSSLGQALVSDRREVRRSSAMRPTTQTIRCSDSRGRSRSEGPLCLGSNRSQGEDLLSGPRPALQTAGPEHAAPPRRKERRRPLMGPPARGPCRTSGRATTALHSGLSAPNSGCTQPPVRQYPPG